MAGLYAIIGASDPSRLDGVAQRMRYGTEAERRFQGTLSYVWLAHDDADQYGPAVDPRSGVQVVAGGRLVWPAGDWQRAERLPYDGGRACRLLLDRYLAGGAAAVAPYNGAATVLIWDPRFEMVHLWTDQFGYHPAFLYGLDTNRPVVFTTFPEALRHDPAVNASEDEVSMAEFLRAWRPPPPHTYFRYLKHAGAATHWQWDLRSGDVRHDEYWRPFTGDFFRSPQEAAEALAAALRSAVSERTSAARRVGLFVSGGADSRVMLFGADDPSKVIGVNLYETEPTKESLIARSLCERAGATYIGVARDADYYPRMLAENVRWSGAMWSAEDNHYLGVKRVMDEGQVDLVMTACTTDWVFKGYGLEKAHRRLVGRNLPLKRFVRDRVDGFLPNYPRESPPEFRPSIDDRMQSWFAGCPRMLEDDLDHLHVEDRRIRPACYTVSVSGQIMYRTYPYDTFLADSRVAACYARIPARMKLNSQVWGGAAALVCRGAGDIVDANNGWAVDSTNAGKLLSFARGWVARRIRSRGKPTSRLVSNSHPPCTASWPDLGWYATHSPTIRQIWNEAPADLREQLTRLWGSDPWAQSLEGWSHAPLDFFRIVTMFEYLRSATAKR